MSAGAGGVSRGRRRTCTVRFVAPPRGCCAALLLLLHSSPLSRGRLRPELWSRSGAPGGPRPLFGQLAQALGCGASVQRLQSSADCRLQARSKSSPTRMTTRLSTADMNTRSVARGQKPPAARTLAARCCSVRPQRWGSDESPNAPSLRVIRVTATTRAVVVINRSATIDRSLMTIIMNRSGTSWLMVINDHYHEQVSNLMVNGH